MTAIVLELPLLGGMADKAAEQSHRLELKMQRVFSIALMLSFLGCASNNSVESQDKDKRLITKVYTSPTCTPLVPTVDPEFAQALAGLIVAPLVESAVKGVGNSIKKAGEDKVTTRNAIRRSNFYLVVFGDDAQERNDLKLNVGCVTVVHGAASTATDNDAIIERVAFRERFKSVAEGSEWIYLFPGSTLTSDNCPVAQESAGKASNHSPYGSVSSKNSADSAESQISAGSVSNQDPTPVASRPTCANTFTEDIRFFAQYSATMSTDRTAMRLDPNTVLIGAPFVKPKRSASGKRDIVVVLSFQLPSQSGSGDGFAVSTSNFANVKSDTVVSPDKLSESVSGWMPLAPLPKTVSSLLSANEKRRKDLQAVTDELEILEKRQKDLQALIGELEADGKPVPKETLNSILKVQEKITAAEAALSRLEEVLTRDESALSTVGDTPQSIVAPVTVAATLVETQEGNEFLVKLGSFLSENSTKIAEPIIEQLDPAKRQAAAATAADAEDDLRVKALEAAAAYNLENAKTGDERNELAIRVAQIRAEQACRKLRAEGYEDVVCLGI